MHNTPAIKNEKRFIQTVIVIFILKIENYAKFTGIRVPLRSFISLNCSDTLMANSFRNWTIKYGLPDQVEAV